MEAVPELQTLTLAAAAILLLPLVNSPLACLPAPPSLVASTRTAEAAEAAETSPIVSRWIAQEAVTTSGWS